MGFIRSIITCIATICNAQWTAKYNPLLPRKMAGMACGSNNGSIFLLGGWDKSDADKQVLEYKISANNIVDYGEIGDLTQSYSGTFWYQLNETLYVYGDLNRFYFTVYDLKVSNFWESEFRSIIYPPEELNDITRVCIAGNSHYLTISGGWPANNQVHILLLSTNIWINGTSMQTNRETHGCCFVSDHLYAIGGGQSTTIEKIHSDHLSISSESWTLLQNTFNAPIKYPSVVPYFNYIYVIGNVLEPLSGYHDGSTIYIINTIDDSVTLLPERLPYDVNRAASIIVDDILYMFGGRKNGTASVFYRSWIKHQLVPPTNAPTNAPTTLTPSNPPSQSPIFLPTKAPFLTTDIPQSTRRPSKTPSMFPYFVTTDDELGKLTHASNNENNKSVDISISITAFWIIAISLSICVCGAIFYFLFSFCVKLRKQMKDNSEENQAESIKINKHQKQSVILASSKSHDTKMEPGADDDVDDDDDDADIISALNETAGNQNEGLVMELQMKDNSEENQAENIKINKHQQQSVILTSSKSHDTKMEPGVDDDDDDADIISALNETAGNQNEGLVVELQMNLTVEGENV